MHEEQYRQQSQVLNTHLGPHWGLVGSTQQACADVQATKAAGSCPFLKAKAKAKENFKEAILAQPVDVEELGKQGRRKVVCPYYTARSAVPDAQLVLLPYSALLAQVSQHFSLHGRGHTSYGCIAICIRHHLHSSVYDGMW